LLKIVATASALYVEEFRDSFEQRLWWFRLRKCLTGDPFVERTINMRHAGIFRETAVFQGTVPASFRVYLMWCLMWQ
jgi:hypothetical protein